MQGDIEISVECVASYPGSSGLWNVYEISGYLEVPSAMIVSRLRAHLSLKFGSMARLDCFPLRVLGLGKRSETKIFAYSKFKVDKNKTKTGGGKG